MSCLMTIVRGAELEIARSSTRLVPQNVNPQFSLRFSVQRLWFVPQYQTSNLMNLLKMSELVE